MRKCTGSARIHAPGAGSVLRSIAATGISPSPNAWASHAKPPSASRSISARASHFSSERRRGDAGSGESRSGTSKSSGIGGELSHARSTGPALLLRLRRHAPRIRHGGTGSAAREDGQLAVAPRVRLVEPHLAPLDRRLVAPPHPLPP